MEKKEKHPISFRVTADAKMLLNELSEKLGISRNALLEIIVREKAKAEGIET